MPLPTCPCCASARAHTHPHTHTLPQPLCFFSVILTPTWYMLLKTSCQNIQRLAIPCLPGPHQAQLRVLLKMAGFEDPTLIHLIATLVTFP